MIIYPAKPKWLLLAEKEAIFLHWPGLILEHIFIGLLAFREGVASHVLRREGLKLRKLQAHLEAFNGYWGINRVESLQLTDPVKKLLTSLEGTTLSSGLALLKLLEQAPDNGIIGNVWLKGRERKNLAEQTEQLLSDQSLIYGELAANDKEFCLNEYWAPENGFHWELIQDDARDFKTEAEHDAAEMSISLLTPDFLTWLVLEKTSRISGILLDNFAVSLDLQPYRRSLQSDLKSRETDRNFSHCSMRAMERSWEIAQSFGQQHINLGNIFDALMLEKGRLIKDLKLKLGDDLTDRLFSEQY